MIAAVQEKNSKKEEVIALAVPTSKKMLKSQGEINEKLAV